MKVVVDTSVIDIHFYVLSEIRVPQARGGALYYLAYTGMCS